MCISYSYIFQTASSTRTLAYIGLTKLRFVKFGCLKMKDKTKMHEILLQLAESNQRNILIRKFPQELKRYYPLHTPI